MKRQLLAPFVIAFTFVSLMVLPAQLAQASTSCRTVSKTYSLSDGSVPLRVGWTRFHAQICTDGHEITDSSGTTEVGNTGPGEAAGFDIGFGSPFHGIFRSGGTHREGTAILNADGNLRQCIPYTVLWCGFTETYQEHVRFDMIPAGSWHVPMRRPNFHLHHRAFYVSWSPHCTNRVCGVRFHNA